MKKPESVIEYAAILDRLVDARRLLARRLYESGCAPVRVAGLIKGAEAKFFYRMNQPMLLEDEPKSPNA